MCWIIDSMLPAIGLLDLAGPIFATAIAHRFPN